MWWWLWVPLKVIVSLTGASLIHLPGMQLFFPEKPLIVQLKHGSWNLTPGHKLIICLLFQDEDFLPVSAVTPGAPLDFNHLSWKNERKTANTHLDLDPHPWKEFSAGPEKRVILANQWPEVGLKEQKTAILLTLGGCSNDFPTLAKTLKPSRLLLRHEWP